MLGCTLISMHVLLRINPSAITLKKSYVIETCQRDVESTIIIFVVSRMLLTRTATVENAF